MKVELEVAIAMEEDGSESVGAPRKQLCSFSVIGGENGVMFERSCFLYKGGSESCWNAASACGTHSNVIGSMSEFSLRGVWVCLLMGDNKTKIILIPYMHSYIAYPILLSK